MADQKDIVKTLTSLKGIGKVKAEAIIEEGFDTVEKISQASIEELCEVNGVSESVARSIKEQLGEQKQAKPTPAEKPEKTVEPKEQPKKPKEQPTPPPTTEKEEKKPAETIEEYTVKKKPSLSKEIKHHLTVRKNKKKQRPHFLRQEWFRYKRVPKNWRRPDGITSKMRINKKYRIPRVRVGFRGPKQVRGLHPSGFEEVLVHNTADLEKIDADKQAARIGSTVGTKKRVAIAEKAKELDIRLLNK